MDKMDLFLEELERFLSKRNRATLKVHQERTDRTYTKILNRIEKLSQQVEAVDITSRQYNLIVREIKKDAYNDISNMLEEDLMLLLPLLTMSAIYAYNKHIVALFGEGYESQFFVDKVPNELMPDVEGEYMHTAARNNVDNFRSNVSKIIDDFRNNARRDVKRAFSRFKHRLNNSLRAYLRKMALIVWQETRRVTERFKYLSVKALTKITRKRVMKLWRTKRDDRVRLDLEIASHVAMEGTTIYWKDRFHLVPYGTTLYPRGSGILKQDINCRCVLKYFISKGVV